MAATRRARLPGRTAIYMRHPAGEEMTVAWKRAIARLNRVPSRRITLHMGGTFFPAGGNYATGKTGVPGLYSLFSWLILKSNHLAILQADLASDCYFPSAATLRPLRPAVNSSDRAELPGDDTPTNGAPSRSGIASILVRARGDPRMRCEPSWARWIFAARSSGPVKGTDARWEHARN